MQLSANYGLKLMEGTDNVKRQDFVDNFTKIDTEIKNVNNKADSVGIPYVTSTGTANTYAVTLSPAPTAYTDGMRVTVKINVACTGASTLNVNSLGAKAIKDSLGNAITSGGLKANTPYTFCYESTSSSFILLGKGGGGTATAAQLLLGQTATVDSGQITGTLDLTNLVSGNIKSGVTINGVSGKASVVDTSDALATAAQILSGASAYVGGVKIAGNIPNNYGVWQYSGVPGASSGRLHMYPPKGYYDPSGGTGIYYDDANYTAANIVNGVSIFGLVGSATIASLGGKQFASGNVYVATTRINMSLSFTPSIVIMVYTNPTNALWIQEIDVYINGTVYMFGRSSSSNSWSLYMDTGYMTVSTNNISFIPRIVYNQTYTWYAIG